jgi:translocation and assembly module TamB
MKEAVPRNRTRRWAGRVTLGVGALLLLLMAASPWWYSWLLQGIAGRMGVSLGGLERFGWSAVRLRDVEATAGAARIQIERLVLPQPGGWLHRWLRDDDGTRPVVVVSNWSVVVRPAARPAVDPSAAGPGEAMRNTLVALSQTHWLGGPALLTNGHVRIGPRELDVPGVWIHRDRVTGRVAVSGWEVDAAIRRSATDTLHGRVDLQPSGWFVDLQAVPTNALWRVNGTAGVSTQEVRFAAVLDPNSVLPVTASITGNDVLLPLPEVFPGSARGDLDVTWENGTGRVILQVEGTTRFPSAPDPVPLEARVRGGFTTNHIDLEELRVQSDLLNAHLSQPIRVPLARPWELPATTLAFSAQVDRLLPGVATGVVTGLVASTGDIRGRPRIEIELNGERVAHGNVPPADLRIQAAVEWPDVRLEVAEFVFVNGARASAEGRADLQRKEVLSGAWSAEGRLPVPNSNSVLTNSVLSHLELSAHGVAQGSFTNLSSEAEVRTLQPVQLAGVRPLEFVVRCRFTGKIVDHLAFAGTTGEARMQGVAAIRPPATPDEGWQIRVESLSIGTDAEAEPMLQLANPARISWLAGETNTTPIRVEISRTELRGSAGEIAVDGTFTWPSGGQLNVSAHEFSAAFITNWIANAPDWVTGGRVESLTLVSDSREGFLDGNFEVRAEMPVPDVGRLALEVKGAATRRGVQVSELRMKRGDRNGLVATMDIPARIQLGPDGPRPELVGRGRLGGVADIASDSWFWDWLAARTGIAGRNPVAHFEFAGPAESPRLGVALQAERVDVSDLTGEATAFQVEELQVRTELSPRELVVDGLSLKVRGQEARAIARVPLSGGADQWWVDPPKPDWREATAELVIPRAALAPITSAWSNVFQSSGELSANLQLRDGGLHGWLEITNIAARPIPSVGTIRDMTLRLEMDERRGTLQQGSATLNGQPLTLSGWVEWQGRQDYTAEFRMTGTNLAVLRSTAALLRTDLDLAMLRTNTATPPMVSGTVDLRDSVVMMDILELVSVDLERPEKRPPYFSIPGKPFAEWGLDVRVRGSKFARIVSPAFHGSVSADARLGGSMRDPRLVGEGVVDSGRIIFPFGQLQVEQARIRFTEADPYRPKLEGRAEGMNFGYNVTLTIGGTLTDPELRFSTIPPMSTREALQMLTAGTVPRQEYSFTGSQRVQKVGTYLARDLLSTITGNPSTEPRLSIRSGQRVTSEGKLTYGLEYRLTDRWYLVGEYDRWSQFNAGVRWRILQK